MAGVMRGVIFLLAVVAVLNAEYSEEDISYDQDVPNNLEEVAKPEELIGGYAAIEPEREKIVDLANFDFQTDTKGMRDMFLEGCGLALSVFTSRLCTVFMLHVKFLSMSYSLVLSFLRDFKLFCLLYADIGDRKMDDTSKEDREDDTEENASLFQLNKGKHIFFLKTTSCS